MSKIALISDTHWGVRNNSLVFLDLMKFYYDKVLFPYLVENNIKTLLHGGDLVENRASVNYRSLRYMKTYFFDKLSEHDIDLHIIPGNHDIFYRNDIEINAVQELYLDHPKVHLYNEPTEVEVEGAKFLMVPWMTFKNNDKCLKAIKESKADYCLGHFEVADAKMYKNSVSEHGLKASLFNHFKKVYSGHYHHASRIGKVQYISGLFHTTWQCYDDQRGFVVLDTKSGKDEYIENEYSLFKRLQYDDRDGLEVPTVDALKDNLEGCIVDLVVTHKEDVGAYKKFRDHLNQIDLVDLNVSERYLMQSVDVEESQQIMENAKKENPLTVLLKYTSEYSKADETVLKDELSSMYSEAVDKMAEGE